MFSFLSSRQAAVAVPAVEQAIDQAQANREYLKKLTEQLQKIYKDMLDVAKRKVEYICRERQYNRVLHLFNLPESCTEDCRQYSEEMGQLLTCRVSPPPISHLDGIENKFWELSDKFSQKNNELISLLTSIPFFKFFDFLVFQDLIFSDYGFLNEMFEGKEEKREAKFTNYFEGFKYSESGMGVIKLCGNNEIVVGCPVAKADCKEFKRPLYPSEQRQAVDVLFLSLKTKMAQEAAADLHTENKTVL